jgi:hypothetical protein
MLKKILIAVLGLGGVLAGVVAIQPNTYKVTRALKINAPVETVFPMVRDYHRWEAWSPWAKLDPNMKVTYSGPEEGGVGSTYSWSGNDKVGSGKMTTIEVLDGRQLKIKLDFLEPFASTSMTHFTFAPDGAGTAVTWEMSGEADFITKAMSLVSSMDSMVGPDFEKGLRSMKEVAESSTPKN